MSITATIAAMKTSIDIAWKAIEARDEMKLKEVKIALLDEVLSVREQALDLLQEKDALAQEKSRLENEIRRLKDHQADIQQNYERWTTMNGATVYRSKPGIALDGRTEYLCANCVSDGQKTYLQPQQGLLPHKCPRGHGAIALN